MNTALLLALAPYVVPVLVAVLTPLVTYLVGRIGSNMPANQRSLVSSVVRTGVSATEQMVTLGLNGPGKKQQALEMIEKELANLHIKIDPSQLNALIEETVFALNQAKGAPTVSTVSLPLSAAPSEKGSI